jgi:hypothetical protein
VFCEEFTEVEKSCRLAELLPYLIHCAFLKGQRASSQHLNSHYAPFQHNGDLQLMKCKSLQFNGMDELVK